MNQGALEAYLGRYVDSITQGPVWHRMREAEVCRLTVSLIVSIYGLWLDDRIDVVLESTEAKSSIVRLVSKNRAGTGCPPLEQHILAVLREKLALRPHELVATIPFRAKPRGVWARFISPAPSVDDRSFPRWFGETSTFDADAPMRVCQALDLAKALVLLESGDGSPEEERERLENALQIIETEVLAAVEKRA